MKRYWLAALALALIILGMVWLLAGVPVDRASVAPAVASQPAMQPAAAVAGAAAQATATPGQAATAAVASADPGLDKAAILSMSEARQHGDPRAPPMSPSGERDPPTQAELNDPALYAGYEKAQQLKLYQSYINAVPKKVATLQKALDEAAQPGSGITPEQMAFARKKIADLNAMQQKLLAENPTLKAPVTQGQSATASTNPSP